MAQRRKSNSLEKEFVKLKLIYCNILHKQCGILELWNFVVTSLLQKFCQTNCYTKEFYSKLIRQKNFMTVNFFPSIYLLRFSTLCGNYRNSHSYFYGKNLVIATVLLLLKSWFLFFPDCVLTTLFRLKDFLLKV